jgi:PAS domain S-box-containing protein
MKNTGALEGLLAGSAGTYLLETAPVLALQLDTESRLVEANAYARRVLGEQAIGCPLADCLAGFPGPLELAALAAGGHHVHRLSLRTAGGPAETLGFRFFPLPDGTLALGSTDFDEQRKQANDLLALNRELSQRTRQLHQANEELRESNELKDKLTERLQTQNIAQHHETLALLNLMEDALAARQRAERAAEELRASEARGRAVFDNAPDAALIVYPGGRCLQLNAITLPRYGYSLEEFLAMTPKDLAAPGWETEFAAEVEGGFSNINRFESRHRSKDGSEFPVDVTVSPLVLDGVTSVLCIIKDSSQRKKAEEALQRSELRCRSILEAAPDPMVVVNQASQMVLVNAAAERVFGYTRAELLGKPVRLLIPFGLPDAAAEATEGLAIRQDGIEVPVEVRLSAEVGPTDGAWQTTLAIRDLSRIKRAEAKFQKLLETAPDAVVVVGGDGQIVLVNTQTERIFGYPRETLLGRNIDVLFPERVRPERAESWAACFGNPQKQGLAAEFIGVRQDGSEFPVEAGLSLLETAEGALIFSAIRDVTERKNTEQRSRELEIKAAEAEAANRAKSMFLSTMSHEIRTPLNAVLGYSQLMLRDPALAANAKANLKIINRSGEHLLKMIDEILDLAKIEAGRMELTSRTFQVRGLLRDMEAMFRLRAEAKGLQLAAAAGGEPVEHLRADEGKIRQVLINLVGNAIKFTERGRIELELSLEFRAGGRLWLSARVGDTGMGMTAEELSTLFRPFVQGEGGQHTRQGGTGLGLAISQEVAHLMGGEITVRSTPGLGSSFLLEIPVQPASGRGFSDHTVLGNRVLCLDPGQRAPRILVADDLHDNRDWLSKLLTAVGFDVRSAENGEAAVMAWQEWGPRLILMDIHMPGMTGLEATRRIRSQPGGRETVIIALTADAMEDNRQAVLGNNMNDFISKPCAEAELLEKIRAHLGVVYRRSDALAHGGMDPLSGAPPDLEELRTLPALLVRRLRQATLYGDKALLDELIMTIGDKGDSQSARTLRELADGYRYDELMQLLEEACAQ